MASGEGLGCAVSGSSSRDSKRAFIYLVQINLVLLPFFAVPPKPLLRSLLSSFRLQRHCVHGVYPSPCSVVTRIRPCASSFPHRCMPLAHSAIGFLSQSGAMLSHL